MFQMTTVGRCIADLRKDHNMTQMELADKLGISFQAVSNWERGNSMPDISKLPELAELFGVTIDALLDEHSNLIKSAIDGNLHEYVENNHVTGKELSDIAPLLKPDQIDEIFVGKEMDDLEDIEDLLPFLNSSVLDELAQKIASSNNYHNLDVLAPFMSKDTLNGIARKMIAEGKNIAEIAPFVSKDIIGELAERSYTQHGLSALEDFAPFIPRERLTQIAELEYAKHGLRYFESIAPFLDRTYLSELAGKSIQKDGIKAISNIAPFLDRDMLSKYVREKYL